MRLWSIHPKYLDTKGILALWREGLLAQKVLQGNTKGYRYHPQLIRFLGQRKPIEAISTYLHVVCDEADMRGYAFQRSKILTAPTDINLIVSSGQVMYEWQHLLSKLKKRDINKYTLLKRIDNPQLNSIFTSVQGPVEHWEKISP